MAPGNICILRDEQKDTWSVWLCQGPGNRSRLRGFEDHGKAAEFALEEQGRRRRETGDDPPVHIPDDCPCYNPEFMPA